MNYCIQNLQFPDHKICDREKMYFHADTSCVVDAGHRSCMVPLDGCLDFFTYFNSFSIGKWKKYTILDSLFLNVEISGSFLLKVEFAEMVDSALVRNTVLTKEVSSSGRSVIRTELPADYDHGILSFSLTSAADHSCFYGGFYSTEVESAVLEKVHLALDICTFKREEYIQANIRHLKMSIIDNPQSPLYDHLDIFISDNAQTLPETVSDNHVHVFKNKNLGGAGGFGRCMVEIMKVREENGFTHILMMDDDILISYETILKTAAILSLLKPAYKDAFIGGHMLKLDRKNIQSEAADYFHSVRHSPVGPNYDLEDLTYIVKNEEDTPINYLSWWYCCMPVGVLSEDNLPIPVFIKRDDIEYGLRNGKDFIVMNGVNVWHEAFDYKYSSYLNYYYYRNLLILISRHRPEVSPKKIWKYIGGNVIRNVLIFRYKDAELILFGVNDFLKGIDWLKKQDGEQLNKRLMSLGYKKIPLDQIEGAFDLEEIKKCPAFKEGKGKKILRLASLNGWLLPAGRSIVVPAYKPNYAQFHRAAKALNYEASSETGFITEKNYASLFAVIKEFLETQSAFFIRYRTVQEEYASRFGELTNLDFWNEYLFRDGEAPEFKSKLPQILPKSTGKEKKRLVNAYAAIAGQILFFWLPVKNNRIMLSVDNRRGYTCNPKYIADELLRQYGDKLDLIWVTKYPNTCDEIRDLGIDVVRMGSMEHLKKYLRTSVYITNDMFPVWAVHRKRQLWINTWHGAINYKHIGYKYLEPRSKAASSLFRLGNRQADVFLSATDSFTEDTSASFNFDKKIFVDIGLPRNDLFFSSHDELAAKIKCSLSVPLDSHVVLYAPTFRKIMVSDTYDLDFSLLKASLSERFGGIWTVLFRNHTFISDALSLPEGVINATEYPDMNELLYVSDVLISDYSSCMYDFSLQEKPCFVYATDIENYSKNDRTFAIPVSEWPYPIATSNEELAQNILSFDSSEYDRRLKSHFQKVGRHDCGNASVKVVEIIAQHCGLSS